MRNLFLASVALGLLAGCAVTNATLKNDDGRTVARSINDINASRAIKARMLRAHGFKLGSVDVEVREGIALLSGRVPREEDRVEAERIAWSAPNIDSLGNEIEVRDGQSTWRNAKDGVLEKSVRTRLIASGKVDAIDLNIETHNGIVYMLGMVDSLEERDHATRIASTTRGTKEVVSYIKVRGEDPVARPNPVPVAEAPIVQAPAAEAPSYAAPARPKAPAFELPEEVVTDNPVVVQSPLANVPGAGEVRIEPIPVPGDAEQGAPFYLDPDSGERIPVRFDGATGTYLVID